MAKFDKKAKAAEESAAKAAKSDSESPNVLDGLSAGAPEQELLNAATEAAGEQEAVVVREECECEVANLGGQRPLSKNWVGAIRCKTCGKPKYFPVDSSVDYMGQDPVEKFLSVKKAMDQPTCLLLSTYRTEKQMERIAVCLEALLVHLTRGK